MGWRDTAETLLEALIPDDIEANESPEQILARVEATTQPDVGDAEAFSGAELRKAVLALKRGKYPGLDRIEAEAAKGQRVADSVVEWCQKQKLQLSAEKIEMLLVKGSLVRERPPVINVYGKSIRMKDSIRYLGIHLDAKLRIDTHVENVTSGCGVMFNSLARVAKSNWGLGHKAMSTLYKGLFVPITTYAAAGWADLLEESHRRKLPSVQRHALLRVTKAYRTVSTDAIPVIAGVLPIDLAITERALQYKIRRSINFEFEGLAFQEDEAATGSRTRSLLRARLREAILRTWQRRWSSSSKGRTTFEFFDDVQTRLRSNWVRLDAYVVQFLSGHRNFRAKLRAFNSRK
ncbi:hypothetical protein KPH14_000689 [Odynerus spinipes]|uniref:Reverse transcriptase n=1 Tax=Odynerus spinipes TaxID=1348599 RepID=A0AAD9RDS5_9HYME|nr:hypothetical protein KPH14_000689 [Odynerus spinipes]